MKGVLVFIAAIFILGACGGEDPVAASHDKMMYDYSDPSEMDNNDIILPQTNVIVQGEIIGIDEAVSQISASRMSSAEDKTHETVAFEENNVLRVESDEGEGYIVLINELDSLGEGDFITVTGTFEGINGRTFYPLIKADSVEELSSDE